MKPCTAVAEKGWSVTGFGSLHNTFLELLWRHLHPGLCSTANCLPRLCNMFKIRCIHRLNFQICIRGVSRYRNPLVILCSRKKYDRALVSNIFLPAFYISQIIYCIIPCSLYVDNFTNWMNLNSMFFAIVMTNVSYQTPSIQKSCYRLFIYNNFVFICPSN